MGELSSSESTNKHINLTYLMLCSNRLTVYYRSRNSYLRMVLPCFYKFYFYDLGTQLQVGDSIRIYRSLLL